MKKKTKNTHIVYHIADLDGHLSGLIACEGLKAQGVRDIVMHGHDYSYDHDELMEKLLAQNGDDVYMLDLSLPKQMMISLAYRSEGQFFWFDHHKTAIDDMGEADIRGTREVGKAACIIAWEYFYPEEVLPLGVELLGQYDVWDLDGVRDWDGMVMPFQYFWKYQSTMPHPDINSPLKALLHWDESAVEDMVSRGVTILDYQKRQCVNQAEIYAHEETFNVGGGEYRVICINSNLRNSMALEGAFNFNRHDFMCVYVRLKGQWVVSFYHPNPKKIDVGKIAKCFGGGGHAGAAGCQLDILPWES